MEDARTALRLYRRYQELKAKGDDFLHESLQVKCTRNPRCFSCYSLFSISHFFLQELYNVGRRLQWTVPGDAEEE